MYYLISLNQNRKGQDIYEYMTKKLKQNIIDFYPSLLFLYLYQILFIIKCKIERPNLAIRLLISEGLLIRQLEKTNYLLFVHFFILIYSSFLFLILLPCKIFLTTTIPLSQHYHASSSVFFLSIMNSIGCIESIKHQRFFDNLMCQFTSGACDYLSIAQRIQELHKSWTFQSYQNVLYQYFQTKIKQRNKKIKIELHFSSVIYLNNHQQFIYKGLQLELILRVCQKKNRMRVEQFNKTTYKCKNIPRKNILQLILKIISRAYFINPSLSTCRQYYQSYLSISPCICVKVIFTFYFFNIQNITPYMASRLKQSNLTALTSTQKKSVQKSLQEQVYSMAIENIEAERLRKTFLRICGDKANTNRSGDKQSFNKKPLSIDKKDLIRILTELSFPYSKPEVDQWIWEVDEDLDGEVNQYQFTLMYKRCIFDKTGLEPRNFFNLVQFLMYDLACRSKITVQDTLQLIYVRNPDPDLLQKHIFEIFGEREKTEDGQEREILFEEYLKQMRKNDLQRRKRLQEERKTVTKVVGKKEQES